ncbi:MAG: hypothetical protein HYT43_00340 [Candidatus Taylorbacteria bacterium]|nr:hypothetical protein [Candidatus Taylorbacteria bacterium]
MGLKIENLEAHHAYLAEGNLEANLETILSVLEKKYGIGRTGNPDLFVERSAALTVDEARELRSRAYTKPVTQKKIFILAFEAITREAENALLKLFEEPPSSSLFFILIPRGARLSGTMRSRLYLLNQAGKNVEAEDEEARRFCAGSPRERLEMSAGLAGRVEKGELSRQKIFDFLNSVESLLARKSMAAESLRALLEIKPFILDKGSSVKMILEYLAFSL